MKKLRGFTNIFITGNIAAHRRRHLRSGALQGVILHHRIAENRGGIVNHFACQRAGNFPSLRLRRQGGKLINMVKLSQILKKFIAHTLFPSKYPGH